MHESCTSGRFIGIRKTRDAAPRHFPHHHAIPGPRDIPPSSPELAPPLPWSDPAERAVLGAIILDNDALARVADLKPQDFYKRLHVTLFSVLLQMHEQVEPIDYVTLNEALERLELDAEDRAYALALADDMPRVTNIEHYARTIKEKARCRAVIYLGQAITERAFGGELPAAETVIEGLRALTAGAEDWRAMFHTFDEFETAKPLSFAIRGFLQNAGATMIGGLSGHGKTLILLSITKALLLGKGHRLWDSFDVDEDGARVLYLIPESSIEPFKHRLKLFGIYPYLAPDSERLFVRTLSKGLTPSLSDPRILQAARGAHVMLDTAIRFSTGDENDASDNQQLAKDIFALLGAGARSVIAAHHSPKPFAKETVMTLENVLRGSGDIGAMLVTAWGVKQLDADSNLIHIQNIKPRDFQPCGPFQIIGRPHIDDRGDFVLYKRPGECGALADEQDSSRDRGGAPSQAREARAANIELLRRFLAEDEKQSSEQLTRRFRDAGINLNSSTVRHYLREAREGRGA